MRNKQRRTARDPQHQELLHDLAAAQEALALAYARFDNAVEPELVDAAIFEINALRARCGYLLRRLKEGGAQAAVCPVTEGAVTWV